MPGKMKSSKRTASPKRKEALARSWAKGQARHKARAAANNAQHQENQDMLADRGVNDSYILADMGRFTTKHHGNGSPTRPSKVVRFVARRRAGVTKAVAK